MVSRGSHHCKAVLQKSNMNLSLTHDSSQSHLFTLCSFVCVRVFLGVCLLDMCVWTQIISHTADRKCGASEMDSCKTGNDAVLSGFCSLKRHLKWVLNELGRDGSTAPGDSPSALPEPPSAPGL